MGRSYPIWNNIEACIYQSSKSYGARNTSSVDVFVGTSAKNSHLFVSHSVTRREVGDYTEFRFYVDGEVIRRAWLKDKELLWEEPPDFPVDLKEVA